MRELNFMLFAKEEQKKTIYVLVVSLYMIIAQPTTVYAVLMIITKFFNSLEGKL